MGDMGDTFKCLRLQKQKERFLRLEKSTKKLNQLGIDFVSKNNGLHLIINKGKYVYDFYPSTSKYRIRERGVGIKGGKLRIGLMNLLQHMGVQK